ncbi:MULTISPECIES: hypothetical protein [Pseudomonas]|uniref:hypothetical protein n=1 Tax=Pseudomonas TaxID=286 RepID=UPI000BA2ACCC|nr:hypothetical protein [Pseudomonas fragi]OZY63315.1 hypothetical protein CJF37_14440 [Pseudomonas fragi]
MIRQRSTFTTLSRVSSEAWSKNLQWTAADDRDGLADHHFLKTKKPRNAGSGITSKRLGPEPIAFVLLALSTAQVSQAVELHIVFYTLFRQLLDKPMKAKYKRE